MDDPANAPGDAEKRLGLLVMPLRDLWISEFAYRSSAGWKFVHPV